MSEGATIASLTSSGVPPPAAAAIESSDSATDHQRWFAEEVQPHDSRLKSYLRGAFPSVRDVDDVVQECYLHVWRRQIASPILSARSFLFKVARHLAIDVVRRRSRSPYDDVADLAALHVLDDKPHAADAACTTEEIDLLLDAIQSLPPRCREIVVLRKLRGLSQKEIAQRLGISERTVEVQGTKGLDRCEEFLRKRGIIR